MTTQVYYRKWRPQRFSDLVGQEPVVRTLKQAVAQKRVAHAYLFCGPRGTGKTSSARILAKAVTCLSPVEDGEPDNACHLCLAINDGRSLDLIEIDAASNRGIDEIRNLRDKIHFVPAEAAYKVYVLDEAHMLTDAAADALLKTLEEPPPHAIFVLATTEPHRLPPTITSRCQRFDFRRIAPPAIIERLQTIAEAEGMSIEPDALRALARSASGSLRDAENLLEQVVTSFGDSIDLEQVRLLLGLTADDRARTLVGHLLRGEPSPALALIGTIAADGLDLRQFHRQVIDELRELLLVKSGARQMVDQPDTVIQEQSALIADVPLERLLWCMRLLGQVTFRHDTPSALPLELAAVECGLDSASAEEAPPERVTPQPVASTAPSISTPPSVAPPVEEAPLERESPQPVASTAPSISTDPVVDPPGEARPPALDSSAEPATGVPASAVPPPHPASLPGGARVGGGLDDQWEDVVKTLSRYKGRRFNLGALLRACRHHWLEGDTLTLDFTHRSHMERMQEEMDNPESRRMFLDAVAKAAGASVPLNLAFTAANGQQTAPQATESPLVKAALNMGGKVLDQREDMDAFESNEEQVHE